MGINGLSLLALTPLPPECHCSVHFSSTSFLVYSRLAFIYHHYQPPPLHLALPPSRFKSTRPSAIASFLAAALALLKIPLGNHNHARIVSIANVAISAENRLSTRHPRIPFEPWLRPRHPRTPSRRRIQSSVCSRTASAPPPRHAGTASFYSRAADALWIGTQLYLATVKPTHHRCQYFKRHWHQPPPACNKRLVPQLTRYYYYCAAALKSQPPSTGCPSLHPGYLAPSHEQLGIT